MRDLHSTNVEAAAYLARMDATPDDPNWDYDGPEAPDGYEDGAPWEGDPWYFDLRCASCGHEYLNTMTCCPACNHDEVVPVE